MKKDQLFNLMLVHSAEEVDQINKSFYGRYNYPWPPMMFPLYPAGTAEKFLNQDLGYWNHDRIFPNPKIWVAGCGTNQALFTALRFPESEVLGTDISTKSLEVCQNNARQLGITNLTLEEKSLNSIDYKSQFDYVICTGVIHHNAEPDVCLKNLSSALKKDGVLELMVYNYYHRLLTTACQKAVRSFYDIESNFDMELELSLIQDLITDFQQANLMGDFLKSFRHANKPHMADSLLQPVEFSYNIESLNKMADECNLELLIHCPNQFDASRGLLNWNMKFASAGLQARYDQLPDVKRWVISNYLMFNDSPMLWFYLQRKDATFKRKTENEICDEFLATRFERSTFETRNFLLNSNGNYILSDKRTTLPVSKYPSNPVANKIHANLDPAQNMHHTFSQLGIDLSFQSVNDAKLNLTNSAFPYLKAK
ncbi:MAG: class I SAM-dependent methyltransferase [Williamsia sp.]|nr:class I SAM-dependent methyltransferase [Williamsia sp.]